MLKSKSLEEKINETEEEAWQALRGVVNKFLGNTMNRNYKELVKKPYQKFPKHGLSHVCKTSFLMLPSGLFQNILVTFVKSMVSDFTRMFDKWRDYIKIAGIVQ